MTTGEPRPLPDAEDLLLGHERGFTPKSDSEEPEEAPPGKAGASRTPPAEE
jgi:hypothetical protein